MELRLPLEMSPGRETACRAVFGTWGFFPKRQSRADIEALREFCEREGKEVTYRKGDQLEREGDPARWFGFVTEGCFRYVTYGISDDREHITWFSFEGEFAGDYPNCLDGRPSQTTIKAMMPSRMLRVSGEQLVDFFRQDAEKMEFLLRQASPFGMPSGAVS